MRFAIQTAKKLAEQQYSFRAQHSTEYAAIKLFDHISKEMDSGNTPTALYIDLTKAFDTLSFDIILQKLKYYGVMATELRLLTDYLTNRNSMLFLITIALILPI